MGNVIKFPDEGRIVRFGRADGADESATIIILPVIRIERYAEPVPRGRAPYASAGGQRRPPTGQTPLNGLVRCRRAPVADARIAPPLLALLALLILPACSSTGDFGRLQPGAGHRRHPCLGRRGSRCKRRRADLRQQSDRRRTNAARSRLSADRAALRPACAGMPWFTNTAHKRFVRRANYGHSTRRPIIGICRASCSARPRRATTS